MLEPTARALGVELHAVEVHGPDDFERAFTAIAHGQAEALMVTDNPMLQLQAHTERIGNFVTEQRLPTVGNFRN